MARCIALAVQLRTPLHPTFKRIPQTSATGAGLAYARQRHRKTEWLPGAVPVHQTWAMDRTFFTDKSYTKHAVIGIIDHGSRLALRWQVLACRCSWSMWAICAWTSPRTVNPSDCALTMKPSPTAGYSHYLGACCSSLFAQTPLLVR